jgi:hypothetical protein
MNQIFKNQSMSKRLIKYFLVIIVFWGPNAIAQKDFSPEEKDRIADNVTFLIQEFLNTLPFDNTIDQPTVEKIKHEHGDSLAIYKLDSIKQIGREKIAGQIKEHFLITKRGDLPTLTNFAFDTTLVKGAAQLSIEEFANKLTTYYDRVSKTSEPALFIDKNGKLVQNLRPLMREMQISRDKSGNSVIVNFEIGWVSFIYDSISNTLGRFSTADITLAEFYENRNIKLAAQINFKKPGDRKTYSFQAIRKVGEIAQTFVLDDLISKINDDVIKNFNLYASISKEDEPPDPKLANFFISMFNDPDRKSIQCNLFFDEEICNNATDISAREYADKILMHYDEVLPVEVTPNYDSLEILEKTSIDYLVKVPVKFGFIATDKNGNLFDNDEETYSNFFIRVTYSRSLITGKEELLRAELTDIATSDKKIEPPLRPYKKGNWSVYANYQPSMLFSQKEGGFVTYKTDFTLSHGFGVNGQYLWFGKKAGKVIHEESYGVSLGFYFEGAKSSMKFDRFNYNNIIPGGENQPFHRLDFADTVMIALNNYKQELSYSAISIPVIGHFKKDLSPKAFYTLSAGLCFTLPDENSLTIVQSDGFADYKGIKWTEFPNGDKGRYILEDMESKGFYGTDAILNENYPKMNTMITYLVLNPTLSFSINNTIENGFIDIGFNFRYGFNSLFEASDKQAYLVDSDGISHNIFSNGLKENHFFLGLTIGFRYFDEKKIKEFKTIQ